MGRIVDNVGQRSPRISSEINHKTNENDLTVRGQIVDNVGQQSLLLGSVSTPNVHVAEEFADQDEYEKPEDIARRDKARRFFQILMMEIDYWEYILRTQCVSPDEIIEQIDSVFKGVNNLAKEVIFVKMDLTVCGQISECRTAMQRILENYGNMNSHCQGSRSKDGLR